MAFGIALDLMAPVVWMCAVCSPERRLTAWLSWEGSGRVAQVLAAALAVAPVAAVAAVAVEAAYRSAAAARWAHWSRSCAQSSLPWWELSWCELSVSWCELGASSALC